MGAGLAMKRIPRIKFPQRHPKSSGTTRQVAEISVNHEAFKNDDLAKNFFSRALSSTSLGGKASDQPKRTPVSQEEIDAIMAVSDSVHQRLANRGHFSNKLTELYANPSHLEKFIGVLSIGQQIV